jgi:Beta/Gamma crystallin
MRNMAVTCMITLLALAPWVTAGELGRAGEMPQIIAFDGAELTGDHTHVVGDIRRLGKWDNSISSLIILSGTWEFFDDDDFTGTKMATLGPGVYPRVTEKGLKDNSISSIRLVSPAARAAEGRRPR